MLPLYPIQCREVKYIKPNHKFKSVEIVAGSKANLLAHDASNKAILSNEKMKEKNEGKTKDICLSKTSSNSNKSKQIKRINYNKCCNYYYYYIGSGNNNNSLTKMDSFFNSITIFFFLFIF